MKSNSLIQKITDWKVIFTIQVIASVALIISIFQLGALPAKYFTVLVALLVLMMFVAYFLIKPSKQGTARSVIGKLLSILLSIVLLVGTFSIYQGNSVLDKITGANTQTTRISVVVMSNSGYERLSDIKGKTLEYNTSFGVDKSNIALEALHKEEPSIETKEVEEFQQLGSDLYDGKTDAILVDEAYFVLLEADYELFDEETKVIWSYEIEEEIVDISKNVNVTQDTFTVFISGIDTKGKVSTVSRSDVNMLVTVNPKQKQILMTSIPRDYYVTLADRGQKDKLTHAGLSGVENSVKTLEGLMNIDINYYARVNFTSLITMVDALGGITVNSPVSFVTRYGKYQIVQGNNQLNGDQALGFVRERYSLAGGDNDRVRNQQRVLTAMLNKMMSPAIITNYSSVLNSIAGSFETNMSSSEITSLLQMQLDDMASWDIQQIALVGTGSMLTGGAWMPNHRLYYMIPDESSVTNASSLIKQMVNGERIVVSE